MTDQTSDKDFESAFRAHYPLVLSIAQHIVGSRAIAEELAQETFASLHHAMNNGRVDNVGGWVRRAVTRRCLNEKRRSARERAAVARLRPVSTVDEDFSFIAEAELADLLRRLTTQQRLALVLVDVNDLSIADAADAMGCAQSTARVHLARARRAARTNVPSLRPDNEVDQ